jgi:hypothetical protein
VRFLLSILGHLAVGVYCFLALCAVAAWGFAVMIDALVKLVGAG